MIRSSYWSRMHPCSREWSLLSFSSVEICSMWHFSCSRSWFSSARISILRPSWLRFKWIFDGCFWKIKDKSTCYMSKRRWLVFIFVAYCFCLLWKPGDNAWSVVAWTFLCYSSLLRRSQPPDRLEQWLHWCLRRSCRKSPVKARFYDDSRTLEAKFREKFKIRKETI